MHFSRSGIDQDSTHQIVRRSVTVQQWTELDLELPPEVRRALEDAVPEETRRKYDMWWGKAAGWCHASGRQVLPMSTQTLTTWVHHLTTVVSSRTGQPYSVASLNQAVTAIRTYHEAVKLSPPATREVRRLIRAHGGRQGREIKRSAIITPDQLLDVVRTPLCDPRQGDPVRALVGARNRFLALVSFNAWDRRSEFAAAELRHFGVADGVLRWRIPRSKTDQAGAGADVKMPATGDELCPVEAFSFWRAALAGRGIVDGRALRRISKTGKIGPSLSGDGVNEITKAVIKASGVFPDGVDGYGRTFTSHGWRASGFTAARRAGASGEATQKHGRWKTDMSQTYDRAQDPVADNPMTAVHQARQMKEDTGSVT